ncbi:MAG: CYTH domain-containing protein [Candidatus Woesearchaeota archaeon]
MNNEENNEIEVKVIEIKKERIIPMIEELGGEKIFDDIIEGSAYDYDDNRLRKSKKLLRLRKEGETPFLVLKQLVSKDDVKICKEFELEVEDHETMKLILENIGLKPKTKMKKRRTSYRIHGAKFEFDKYLDENSHIPEFMEIEALDKEKLFSYAEHLGLKKEDLKAWSGGDLIKYYSDKK